MGDIEKKYFGIIAYEILISYICGIYYKIKMAAGLTAETKIKTKNIHKELPRLVGSSYLFI
jgi:hypothetical protein